MVNVPPGWTWSAFSIGRNEMAYVAAAVPAGGPLNVRVGLDDNLWLQGRTGRHKRWWRAQGSHYVIEAMGAASIGPDAVRAKLASPPHAGADDATRCHHRRCRRHRAHGG